MKYFEVQGPSKCDYDQYKIYPGRLFIGNHFSLTFKEIKMITVAITVIAAIVITIVL